MIARDDARRLIWGVWEQLAADYSDGVDANAETMSALEIVDVVLDADRLQVFGDASDETVEEIFAIGRFALAELIV